MKWVTRERPKVDRIACPWLVQRFIDPEAEFLYVLRDDVLRTAAMMDAVPYDVPDVELGHHGELCSFDAFLDKFQLFDPALHKLARIVRGADTGRLDLVPEAAGLYAISIGLSRTFADDHEQLRYGMLDALYAWCKDDAHP
ncbi:chromate resistance protein [Caballeronia fortuita]|uniref:Chromate resistance protein n=1 Tax=Caballeronia fortuita TaxID=1777138 RepID=A0A158CNB8_9BURK|nr:chromate resistance protein ChrB domain-containing protein [Caballeronia fortuita]SAK83057.1 chromate resistance protein [Caballeronia fortuita]